MKVKIFSAKVYNLEKPSTRKPPLASIETLETDINDWLATNIKCTITFVCQSQSQVTELEQPAVTAVNYTVSVFYKEN